LVPVCGQALKPTLEKKIIPPLQNLTGKTLNFADRCQSETSNFETAQPIDKQNFIYNKRAET